MIDKLKYYWRLKKLYKKQEITKKVYDNLIKKAKKEGKKGNEIQRLYSEAGSEYFLIQDQIDILITSYLKSEANKLILPIPEDDDIKMWKEAPDMCPYKVLSEKGVTELRSAIRRERKERREAHISWIAIIIGLIGAITGLLAVILK